MRDLKRLSKFLAVVLRHKPEQFGIVLDEQGFAPLDTVQAVIREHYGDKFSEKDLLDVVEARGGKKRYEIIGHQIRAMYGHSDPEIVYEPIIPPEILYHGTNEKAIISIREQGLQPQKRQYVHLTTNRANALDVGQRQAKQPILLIVNALEALEYGIEFYHPEAEHYLARAIPARFIVFPEIV